MQIQKFWVVTQPNSVDTTIEDMCFLTDWRRLELQFKGGLNAERIVKVFDNEKQARIEAVKILKAFIVYHEVLVN